MKPATLIIYILSVIGSAAHAVAYCAWMPAVMAVHFGSAGVADGYSTRTSFFAVSFGIMALNVIVFAVFPWYIKKKRIRRLSVPNSGKWLAPGHIDEFYFFFREKMAWFGIVNIVFGAVISQLVFNANLSADPRLAGTPFIVFLTAYFAFVIIWLFTFFRKLSANRN